MQLESCKYAKQSEISETGASCKQSKRKLRFPFEASGRQVCYLVVGQSDTMEMGENTCVGVINVLLGEEYIS